MKRNAIITAIDHNCGEFLLNHWLKSLKDSTNLTNIDVVVLDFGLNSKQIKDLKGEGVRVERIESYGNIVNSRYAAIAKYLETNKYDQVLLIDGGDIIFQKDISPLFDEDKKIFRAVPHTHHGLFYEFFIPRSLSFDKWASVYRFLSRKPMYNGGFILGPRELIIDIAEKMGKMIKHKKAYGADQIAFNYLAYKYGIKSLPITYNYTVAQTNYTLNGRNFTGSNGVKIIDGKFFDKDGELIAVVHNSGHSPFVRAYNNFGYGKGYNKKNVKAYIFRNIINFLLGL